MDGQYRKRIIADFVKPGFRYVKSVASAKFTKTNISRIAAMLCLCATFSFVAANVNYAYAVSLDGHVLCYASDRSELASVIAGVEMTASEAMGRDYVLESDLTAKLSIGNNETASAQELRNLLLDSILEIKYLYVISLDGKAVCALDTQLSAENVVRRVLSEYINDNTLSVSFQGDVGIEGRYAKTSLLAEPDFAYQSLLSSVKVQTQERETVEETISYDIDTVDDPTLLSGDRVVQSEGLVGKALAVYKVSYVNGVEVDKTAEGVTVINQPVNAVVLRGTRERLSTGSYIWPAEGEITSDFGYRNVSVGSRNHKGIDIASDSGTPIYASDGGEVIMAEHYVGYGKLVQIRHDNNDITYYAH